jgi:hypothetical protein
MVKARVRNNSPYTVTESSLALFHQGLIATRLSRPSPKRIHECDDADCIQDGRDHGSMMAYDEYGSLFPAMA